MRARRRADRGDRAGRGCYRTPFADILVMSAPPPPIARPGDESEPGEPIIDFDCVASSRCPHHCRSVGQHMALPKQPPQSMPPPSAVVQIQPVAGYYDSDSPADDLPPPPRDLSALDCPPDILCDKESPYSYIRGAPSE